MEAIETEVKSGRVVLRVAGKTNVAAIAGAITKSLEEGNVVEVHTIGAGALNQAIKGIAKARGFVAQKGRDLVTRPGFGETVIDGESRTTLIQVCSLL